MPAACSSSARPVPKKALGYCLVTTRSPGSGAGPSAGKSPSGLPASKQRQRAHLAEEDPAVGAAGDVLDAGEHHRHASRTRCRDQAPARGHGVLDAGVERGRGVEVGPADVDDEQHRRGAPAEPPGEPRFGVVVLEVDHGLVHTRSVVFWNSVSPDGRVEQEAPTVSDVTIVEVAARDGLQNDPAELTTDAEGRARPTARSPPGITRAEVASFVNPAARAAHGRRRGRGRGPRPPTGPPTGWR